MKSSKKVCVIVSVYHVMTNLENVSFQRLVKIFSSRKIFVIGPPTLQNYIEKLCDSHANISIIYFDNVFGQGSKYYNRLLISKRFYEYFLDYDFIALSQLDVFIVKDDLDYWCEQGYDNIGAPLFEGYTKPSKVFKVKGNNGGFCLRNPKSTYEILCKLKFRYSRLTALWHMESKLSWKLFRVFRDWLVFNYKIESLKPRLQEDVYWSIVAPARFPSYRSCEPEKAKYFSYDANPRFLYEQSNRQLPMAIHAWWRYNRLFIDEVFEILDCQDELEKWTGERSLSKLQIDE